MTIIVHGYYRPDINTFCSKLASQLFLSTHFLNFKTLFLRGCTLIESRVDSALLFEILRLVRVLLQKRAIHVIAGSK